MKRTRHGRLADGKGRMAIVIDDDLKEELRLIAKSQRRSLSNFVVTQLELAAAQFEAQKQSKRKAAT